MKKGAKHPSPSRGSNGPVDHYSEPTEAKRLSQRVHRCVVTHRIGLLSVTLLSDIVALLRKEKLNLQRNQQGLKKGIEKSVPFLLW